MLTCYTINDELNLGKDIKINLKDKYVKEVHNDHKDF